MVCRRAYDIVILTRYFNTFSTFKLTNFATWEALWAVQTLAQWFQRCRLKVLQTTIDDDKDGQRPIYV